MKKIIRLILVFFIVGISLCFFLTLLVTRNKITIPVSFQTIHYLQKPKIYLTGPLYFPRNLAQNVLGLVTVSPSDVIFFVNKARTEEKSSQLKTNTLLQRVAEMRAQTILKNQNFSHQDPYDHISLDTVMPKSGYSFSYASENIGLGEQSAESFVQGFLSSPSHRQNLLDKNLKDTGVGVAQGKFGDRDVTIVVQVFATPTQAPVNKGYANTEEQNIRTILAGLTDNLNRTNGYLVSQPQSEYYLGWKKLLERQIYLVNSVLEVVVKGDAYTDRERAFIDEYNKNWQYAPR